MHPICPDPADGRGGVDHDLGAGVAQAARDVLLAPQVVVAGARRGDSGRPLAGEPLDEVPPQESAAAGDEDAAVLPEAHAGVPERGSPAVSRAAASRAASWRSASVMSVTSPSKSTVGV